MHYYCCVYEQNLAFYEENGAQYTVIAFELSPQFHELCFIKFHSLLLLSFKPAFLHLEQMWNSDLMQPLCAKSGHMMGDAGDK